MAAYLWVAREYVLNPALPFYAEENVKRLLLATSDPEPCSVMQGPAAELSVGDACDYSAPSRAQKVHGPRAQVKRFILYNILGDVLGLNSTGGPLGFRMKFFFVTWRATIP